MFNGCQSSLFSLLFVRNSDNEFKYAKNIGNFVKINKNQNKILVYLKIDI